MGEVEQRIVDFIENRMSSGVSTVSYDEIMAAIIPADHPEYGHRPPYKYGLDRLRRRGRIGSIPSEDGKGRFYIGRFPREEYIEYYAKHGKPAE